MSDRNRQLLGKVALVTGAASGIGRAAAGLLASQGARVLLVDIEARALAEAQAEIGEAGGTAEARACDLGDEVQIAALLEWAAGFGPLDVLVNAAGITGVQNWLLADGEDDWNRVFAINLRAPYLLIKGIGQRMVREGVAGRIINVTSSSAHRARSSLPAYGASKAGLMQLTRSAAAELGPHGITVNAVAPGLTATPMVTRNFDEAALAAALREGPISNLLNRVSQPQDIGETILFLALPASRQITGQTLHVSAGAIIT